MRVLLDTHSLLWYAQDNPKLSATANLAIEATSNTIFVSVASLWEITIKNSIGKLTLDQPIADFFADNVEGNGFLVLRVERAHLLTVHTLPFHHRDPFDRLLVAQSLVESLTFLSADPVMDTYGVTRLW